MRSSAYGVPLAEADLRHWRQQIGYVPQESTMVNESVAYNLTLGETVAVMMIVSALAPNADWNWSLFTGGETFASKIANNAGEFDNPTKTGAYIAAGLVLFILTFVVNSLARIVIERRKAFSE